MIEAYPAHPTDGASRDDEGATAALGLAEWLCLAATPRRYAAAPRPYLLPSTSFGRLLRQVIPVCSKPRKSWRRNDVKRAVVICGAGTSVDYGVPTTGDFKFSLLATAF